MEDENLGQTPSTSLTDPDPTPAQLSELARSLFAQRATMAIQYAEILASKGIEWGLLGPSEAERIWPRHLANSVALAPLLAPDSTVIDVGSGAGLPGIPLALARSDLKITLLEPLLRRYNFLVETCAQLKASNIKVQRGRAEEHQTSYQYVVCRGVAPLTRLLKWCLPLVKPGGELLALKGEAAVQEVAEAMPQLRRASCAVEIVDLAWGARAVKVSI